MVCLQSSAHAAAMVDGIEPSPHPADLLLEQPLFPAIVRDMVIRSKNSMIRIATASSIVQLVDPSIATAARAAAATSGAGAYTRSLFSST